MGIRPIDSPAGRSLPEEEGGSEQVLQAQRALNQLAGEEVVPENGLLTPETQRAVEEFQRKNNLPSTGAIDEKTADLMQVALRKMESSPSASAPPAQGTGKQDLTLTGVLMQSRLGTPPGSSPPALRLLLDSFQSSLNGLLPAVSSREGLPAFGPAQNPFLSFGCGIGKDWGDAAIQQAVLQFQSAGALNPDALDFAGLIESIQADPEKLNAQNILPLAQLCAGYTETMLVAAAPRISEALAPSLPALTGNAQIPGADLMKQSGEQLALWMAGTAAGAFAPDAAAGIQAMAGASIAAAAAATGFAAGNGWTLPLLAGAIANLTQQLPELMRRCGVDINLDASAVSFVSLNLEITSVVAAVILATQQQTIVKTDRQVASILHSTIRSEGEISSILVNDALQEVLKHQETTTREVLATTIQAMVVAETANTDQGALVSAGIGNVQDRAVLIRNTVQRVLDITGKIVEASRMLRLLSER